MPLPGFWQGPEPGTADNCGKGDQGHFMQCKQCGHTIHGENVRPNCLYCGASTGVSGPQSSRIRPNTPNTSQQARPRVSRGAAPQDAIQLADLPADLRHQVMVALGRNRKNHGAQIRKRPLPATGPAADALPGFMAGRPFSEEDIDLYLDQLRNQRKAPSKRRNQLLFLVVALGLSIGFTLLI